jgi:hypothetical protein
MSSLATLPAILLERIALEAALGDPLRPPSDLVPLLQSCRRIYNLLAFQNTKDLYARIFKAKFDTAAPHRRFGPSALYSHNLADQLQRYCVALKHIRAGDIYSQSILEDFWIAFIMMSENDGKNELQLQAASLADFVERFVLERLWEDRMRYNQWPAETTINALSLWLMWLTTDHGMLPHTLSELLLIYLTQNASLRNQSQSANRSWICCVHISLSVLDTHHFTLQIIISISLFPRHFSILIRF